jgi:hypothetical protein
MAKKVRIVAWQESEDSAINMANHLGLQGRLGHQKLKKEYFAGPCFLCPGGSLASSRMGQTCPKTSFYPSYLKIFIKKSDFLAFGAFFYSQKSYLWQFFHHFLRIGILFSHEWLKISLIQQFKQILYICI